jgi:SAM-dependent methyltransferase
VQASERLAWTADVVAPALGERVLEVGCGHGVLVSLLTGRCPSGEVVAVDRSATMTAAAARRNRAAVSAGRVRLVTAALTDADLGTQPFDVVVSFNVRAFWTPPAPEWDVVAGVLAPGGRVFVAFQVMGADAPLPIEDAVRRLAAARGLHLAAVHRGRTGTTESVALELRPTG